MSPLRRRVPTWSELRPLVRVEPPSLARTAAALRRAQTVEDLRVLARRRTPRAVFDYVDGAAEGERSLARARQAFADVEFRPRVLRDVKHVDAGGEIRQEVGRRVLHSAPGMGAQHALVVAVDIALNWRGGHVLRIRGT